MANDGAGAAGSASHFARMLQFGDSMFPIGGFSFSSGLESAVQKGVVTDAATLHAFARTAVEQAARGDGIAMIAAHRAATAGDVDALIRIDAQVYARKLSHEARTMSVRMGKKFTEMGVQVVGAPLLSTWLNVSKRPSLRDATLWRSRSTSPCKACRHARRSSCINTVSHRRFSVRPCG